jgi:putative flippase GtrA
VRVLCPWSQERLMVARVTLFYCTVSGVCLVLHNLIIIGGDRLGVPMLLSVLASFCASATTGYLLHSRLTFREPLSFDAFGRYAGAMTANIPLAYVMIWFWHELIGLDMALASPIATVCMVGVNLLLVRWAILLPADQAMKK